MFWESLNVIGSAMAIFFRGINEVATAVFFRGKMKMHLKRK
jgi:hypothetical protein